MHAWATLPAAAAHEFILCSPEPIDHVPYAGLRLASETAPGAGTLWEQRVLPKLVARSRADVLFSPAYTCPLLSPVPIALAIHDVSFMAHPEWFSFREGLRRRTLTWFAARRARRVLTLSDFSRREIVRHLGIDQTRVEVISLGVPTLHHNGASREPLVLYVGSLFNRRHIPELIEGFRRLASVMPAVRLEIVGDNRTMPHVAVEDLIARSGMSGRVHWRSYVADAELESLYSRASAFVFLSDYEGFGLTPLEAMAAGIPIVVLDTEVSREVYGPAAVYVERPDPDRIASALARVLTPGDERSRLIDSGARQIQRYSWRECAERTLQVLLTIR
jgi:glycosyltransferase involved in cell wall biosynthesis